jgi:hypothetical protein
MRRRRVSWKARVNGEAVRGALRTLRRMLLARTGDRARGEVAEGTGCRRCWCLFVFVRVSFFCSICQTESENHRKRLLVFEGVVPLDDMHADFRMASSA